MSDTPSSVSVTCQKTGSRPSGGSQESHQMKLHHKHFKKTFKKLTKNSFLIELNVPLLLTSLAFGPLSSLNLSLTHSAPPPHPHLRQAEVAGAGSEEFFFSLTMPPCFQVEESPGLLRSHKCAGFCEWTHLLEMVLRWSGSLSSPVLVTAVGHCVPVPPSWRCVRPSKHLLSLSVFH